MPYTTVPTVTGGAVTATTFGNAVSAAIDELQDNLPETLTTWSSPIASGITVGSGTVVATYLKIGKLIVR